MIHSHYEKTFQVNKEELEKVVQEATEAELQRMNAGVEEHKEAVVTRILALVCDIRPEMHHNYRLKKKIEELETKKRDSE